MCVNLYLLANRWLLCIKLRLLCEYALLS